MVIPDLEGDPRSRRWSVFLASARPPRVPVRYIIAVISLISSFFAFASRSVLDDSIPYMIPNHEKILFLSKNCSTHSSSQSYEIISSEYSNSSHKLENISSLIFDTNNHSSSCNFNDLLGAELYDWTERERTHILASYYYGYTVASSIAGRYTERLHLIHFTAIAHLSSILITLLTPTFAGLGVWPLSMVRILLGISHAPILPALYVLFVRWFPRFELSTVLALIFVGANCGTALMKPLAGLMSVREIWGGWSNAFYIVAVLHMIFLFPWCFYVTPDPEEHPQISEYELRFIQKYARSNQHRMIDELDWKSMVICKELWVLIIAIGASSFGYSVMTGQIPHYLAIFFGVSAQNNGNISIVMFAAICISLLICGPSSDWLIKRRIFLPTKIRKIFETGTLLVPSICLFLIPLIPREEKIMAITLSILAMIGLGMMSGSEIPISCEMAPNMIGTIIGLTQTSASFSSLFAPILNHILTNNFKSDSTSNEPWFILFYITGSILVCGLMLFWALASSNLQNWSIAPRRCSSMVTVASIEMPESTRYRLWFHKKKHRLSEQNLVTR
ncbi:sialin-like [Brevipalpus obovatus]|uniref:sialin-like n=1 Tax=Brevipalpus obovatus TaxID=246614 RepID=UPI003D9E1388